MVQFLYSVSLYQHSLYHHYFMISGYLIYDLQPFTTNFSFEKNSCKVFELPLLIDYTSYYYEIFSVASTEQVLYRD